MSVSGPLVEDGDDLGQVSSCYLGAGKSAGYATPLICKIKCEENVNLLVNISTEKHDGNRSNIPRLVWTSF
jgi:hypothetical protein